MPFRTNGNYVNDNGLMKNTQDMNRQNEIIKQVLPEDLPALDELFRSRFHHPLDFSLWHWKYAENRGFALGSRDADHKLITHYGALTRAVLFHGLPVLALQMADVVASIRSIPGVSRRPPIYLAVKHIAESYLGLNKPYLLAFGFPNRRAYDVFERLGIYQKAGKIFELSLTLSPKNKRHGLWLSCQTIETLTPKIRQQINDLWSDLSKESEHWIIPVKNADFFNYRYFSHPVNHYEIFRIRNRITGKPLVVLVLKKITEHHFELLDFVCPLNMLQTTIQHAASMTRELGGNLLTCWASDPIKEHLAAFFDSVHDTDVIIPTNAHTPSPPMNQIEQQWWLMGGDTDFK